jgi:1-acyl-sn-glycerol-3-phosphate acyltransferase
MHTARAATTACGFVPLRDQDVMRIARSILRSVTFLSLLLAAVVDGQWRKLFCGMKVGPEGAVWVSAWCRRIMRALDLRCEVQGPLPQAGPHGLAVVSNHLSYLDILVLSATRPFVMVSKCEVRGWPLLGWMTAQAGTVYIERADVKGGQRQTHAQVNRIMHTAFSSGLPVLFFPEGTTSSGDRILPFRRGLFNSIVAGQVPLQTAALAYQMHPANRDCTLGEDICFVGEAEFAPHLFKALGLKGVRVTVRFGANEIEGSDRFALATNARDAVVDLYEPISGLRGLERHVTFPSRQGEHPREHLLDRPVERVGTVYGQAGMGR